MLGSEQEVLRVVKILVIDDNPIDRHLIGALLGQQADMEIEFANDGGQALAMLPESKPDLIVTDLQMPVVDGLELVKAVKRDYSNLPVVLITSHGSEKTAIEALQHGAASYSPKSVLEKDLVRTVRQVLELSQHLAASAVVKNQPIPTNLAFVLENDLGLIGPLIEHLQHSMPAWSSRDQLQIGMAIDEALVNAMHHGNLEVSADLRDGDDAEYYRQIQQRRQQSPYCDRKVRVQAEFSDQHVCIQISDEGRGFDPADIPDPTAAENVQKVGGRGLFLIRSFMNQVVHNQVGNQITFTKIRPAPGSED
ncbi:MAG: response regulator [Mariniblastus sp.]|nr:response regulator [Mariniblastus sp.]